MRTFVITGALILASGLAGFASTSSALASPATSADATAIEAVLTDGARTDDDAVRALGRAILGARGAESDDCAVPSLS